MRLCTPLYFYLYFYFLLLLFYANKPLKLSETDELAKDVGGCIPENDSTLNGFLDLVPTFG